MCPFEFQQIPPTLPNSKLIGFKNIEPKG
jgi:hypothetical protein